MPRFPRAGTQADIDAHAALQTTHGNSVVTAGDYFFKTSDRTVSHTSNTPAIVDRLRIGVSGTLRIQFSLKCNYPGMTLCRGQIYRNGTAVGTERENLTESYVVYTEDIAGWSVGDMVEIWGWVQAATSGTYTQFKIRIG